MGADQTVEMMRHLLLEALILSAPLLVGAAAISLVVSLLQTLTSIQEQTLTAVPRLLIVFTVLMLMMPWGVHRLIHYTVQLWTGFQRYLG